MNINGNTETVSNQMLPLGERYIVIGRCATGLKIYIGSTSDKAAALGCVEQWNAEHNHTDSYHVFRVYVAEEVTQ